MLRCVERNYGRPAASAVIPNGREPSNFLPLPKEPFILAAGRLWDQAKNINALSAVAPELPWPVYVAGEVEHPEGGRPVHAQVRPLGRLDRTELSEWFGRASIYALPARYEPFGLSVLEAALAGCALVLGDIPSLREVWSDTALYVPPNDSVALRTTLRRLIENPDERAELARRSRSRAFRYTPERMVGGYLAHYRSLVGEPSGTPEPTEAQLGEQEEGERLECVS
jgi:glycosyltransferase involved in cell wall biosynthesis